MSDYKFSCSHCGQHLTGSEGWAGKVLQCPSCQEEFVVPDPFALPPVIPSAPPAAVVPGLRLAHPPAGDAPPVLDGRSDLEQQVLDGGRFVIYQYCISVLVMSFKRSSRIEFLRAGEDGVGPAVSNSLISLVAGWWGIPWGPIWTITTVIKNARGGTDVTQAVLAEKLGPGRAAHILTQRRIVPPQGWGMKVFRWGLGGFALLPVLFVALLFTMALASPGSRSSNRPLAVGEAEFQSANRQIGVKHGSVAFGNSSKAITVAGEFSTSMKTFRKTLFEGGKKEGLSASGHEFLTYCELNDSECAMIVHVPELRRFSADAKVELGELAWLSAQVALKKQGVASPGMKLAVGLRGIALYDRVLIGTVVANPQGTSTGLGETVTDSHPEQRLYPFFGTPSRSLPARAK